MTQRQTPADDEESVSSSTSSKTMSVCDIPVPPEKKADDEEESWTASPATKNSKKSKKGATHKKSPPKKAAPKKADSKKDEAPSNWPSSSRGSPPKTTIEDDNEASPKQTRKNASSSAAQSKTGKASAAQTKTAGKASILSSTVFCSNNSTISNSLFQTSFPIQRTMGSSTTTTPRKSAKKPSSTPAKPLGTICDHGNKASLVSEEVASYFTEKYLKENDFPFKCCGDGCNHLFGKNYKVSGKKLVWLCPNGKNVHHECVHALCKPCYDAWQPDDTPSRKRRPSRRTTDYSEL